MHSELILNDGLSGVEGQGEGRLSPEDYRMTFLLGKNLLLSKVRQFRQLEGCYCSCLLPRQDAVISQIKVNGSGSFLPSRMVTL